MSKEKSSIKSVSISKSKRFFRGFKSLLSSKKSKRNSKNLNHIYEFNQQQTEQEVDVSVTLTTDINQQQQQQHQQQEITILDPHLNFNPPQPVTSSLALFQEKAYVHYDPKRGQVTLGTRPELKHFQSSIVLEVEEYAWLIQQLQEEQNISSFLNIHYRQPLQSAMLGIMVHSNTLLDIKNTTTFGRKLIRLVQQRKQDKNFRVVTPPHHRQCIFMLPKSLLIQAANHIPNAKPLPPIQNIYHSILSQKPFEIISDLTYEKSTRYCRFIALCTHELLFIQQNRDSSSPPSSLISKKNSADLVKIQCADCSISTGLETIFLQQQQQKLQPNESSALSSTILQKLNSIMMMNQSVMFPVSYLVYNTVVPQQQNQSSSNQSQDHEHIFMSSAVQPSPSHHPTSSKSAFDSFTRKQKPHAFSAFQYIPPDKTMSSDDISSISEYSGINEEANEEEGEDEEQDNFTPQKYGYVALDNEHEEILVVFPGMPLSYNMFENASFKSVPWLEIETITSIPPISERKSQTYHQVEEDLNPWVLECALTAWHRCEMKVVTLLMRLCATLPSHYKVVILGYSLGGAVAALCASSLRSTKLLLNRPITVCAIHSPRVGNKSFLNTLSYQRVDTIRITSPRDVMAHLPPRSSGLLHVGDSTIILPSEEDEAVNGYTLQQMMPGQIEDTLNRTFSCKEFDIHSHTFAWDIRLDDNDNQCI